MAATLSIPADNVQRLDTAHLLGFKFSAGCTADNAASHFQCSTTSADQGSSTVEACFRGRQLRGCQVDLPDGYRGVIMRRKENTADDADGADDASQEPQRQWEATHTFKSITHWNHDTPSTKIDGSRRALDWLEVAKQVHQPVSLDAVKAKMASIQANAAAS